MKQATTKHFHMGWHRLSSFLALMLLTMSVYGQTTYTLRGKVTSDTGEPVLGATAQIKNTTFGGVTDISGDYSFQVNLEPGSYTLVIRSLGLLTEEVAVDLGTQPEVVNDIILTYDILSLDEIIVTGSSVATSRKQLGNAISTLDASDLERSASVSVDQALSGKVAGALVQQNSGDPAGGISIRLRGASTVTGSSDPLYIVDGVLVNNNSNELIDIGGTTQNRLVDINPADIDRVEIIKGAAAAAIYGSRASNGVVQIFTKRGVSGKPKFNFTTSLRINELRKEIDVNEVPRNAAGDAVTRFNYQDQIFQTGVGTENNLSVRGGSDKTKYFASGSYLFNEGIVTNSNFERYGFRVNIDQNVNDWLSFNVGLNYTHSESEDIPNGGIRAFYGAITGFLFLDNSFDISPNESGVYPSGPTSFGRPNPLEVIDLYKFGQTTNRVISNIGFTATPFDGFSINYKLGVDYYNQSATGFIPVGNTSGFPAGWATRGDANVSQYNQDINFSYEKEISSAITSTSVLGGTWQGETFERLGLTGSGLAPTVEIPANAANILEQIDIRSEVSYWGAFVQQTFGFNSKLFVTGALRLDGASVFGEDERNQVYAKASGSYLISEEDFWVNSLGDAINSFKIRASWGQAGNLTAIGAFDRFSNFNPVSINNATGVVPSSLQGNENLAPERMDEIEVGFDATFLNDRVGVEFSYYKQDVTDLLLERELALSTGFRTRFENVGSLENSGIELLIRANPIRRDNFNWNVLLTYAANENEITEVVGDVLTLPGSFGTNAVLEGESLGVFYHGFYAREANGEIITDADNLPIAGDGFKVIGDPNPDWVGSLINEVTYDKFSFRLQFDAVQGFDVFNWNRRLLDNAFFGGGPGAGAEITGNRPAGLGGRQAGIREEFVEDGSFVKLRELAIGYTFQPKFDGIESINVSLVGRNLLSFDDYTGWDPEINTAGQSNSVRGFDFAGVPIPRTYQLSINVSF